MQKFLDKMTDLPILKRRALYIVGVVVFTILFLVFLLMAMLIPMMMRMMGPSVLAQGFVVLWVLTIVFAALDALCIFLLVYLRRKKRRRLEEEDRELRRQAAEEGIAYQQREESNRRRNPYIVWIIVVAAIVVAVLLARGLTSRNRAASQAEATIHNGTAEISDIAEVLPGAGTLTEDDAEEMSLPDGVEIQKWYVANGDTVKEGQQLAKVDPVSVMTTIVEVQDKLEELDEGLSEYENQTASDTITAPANGRVIEIYAVNGTPVADTMYDHSALMLLSLDGLMAVTIEESDVSLTAGDPVVVTLSDGTEVDGRVNTVTYHTAVITISDDGPTLGDTVSVKTPAGRSIGEGELYIHSEWKATGFVGTVAGIPVTEGQEVSAGTTLLSLTDTEDSGTYDILLDQRSTLEQQMAALFQVYTDGYLYASCDGVVSGIKTDQTESGSSSGEESGEESGGDSGESSGEGSGEDSGGREPDEMRFDDGQMGDAGNAEATFLVNRETSVRLVSLAETQTFADTPDAGAETGISPSDLYTMGIVNQISGNSVSVTWLNGKEAAGTVSLPDRVSLYKEGKFTYEASIGDIEVGDLLIFVYDGEEIRSVICMAQNSSGDESGYEEGYTAGSEEGYTKGSEEGYTSGREEGYTAGREEGYASGYAEGYAKAREDLGGSGSSGSTGSIGGSGGTGSIGGSGGTGSIGGSGGTGSIGGTGSTGSIGDLGSYGDLSDLYGSINGDGDLSGYGDLSDLYGGINGDFDLGEYGDLSDLYGGLYGNLDLGEYGNINDLYGGLYGDLDLSDLDISDLEALEESERRNEETEADVAEAYGVDEKTLVSITPQDTMMVTITVDEMDVLKLRKGMEALITLDAFPGQSFTGTVSAVHRSGTNNGGTTKYTADITIDRENGMLDGMNASAQITLDSVDDVLCIPEAALFEEDGAVYVYTTYSENNDELGGMTEVTTGVSDGTNVQILSGLEEGSEYFYKYYDVVNYESASAVSEDSLF